MGFVPNREELAWAAGFFDGEGTAIAYTRKNSRGCPYRAFTMAVSQAGNDELPAPEVLERFRHAIGGIGSIYMTGTANQPAHFKARWQWQSGKFETIQAVTAMLWPWLGSVKKNQLSTALNTFLSWPRLGDLMTSTRGREMATKRWGKRAIKI